MARAVQTVLGPVDHAELGLTLIHEHIFADCTPFLEDDPAGVRDLTVTPATRQQLLRWSCSNVDNVLLDNEDAARDELLAFRAAGWGTLVDVTSVGLRPRPGDVRLLSEQTGVHVVHGCGRYIEMAQADLPLRWDAAAAETEILRQIEEGVDGSGVLPGIIGEIGMNGQPQGSHERVATATDWELDSLRGACRACIASGLPMTVHIRPDPELVPLVLDVLDDEQVDPARMSFSHMDNIHDFAIHLEALRRGVYIHYDHFGMALLNDWYSDVGDERRVEWICALYEQGFERRVMVAHDVWCKLQTRVGGGLGYTHIAERVVPLLRARGFGEAELERLLVSNPAAFLAGAD
jgi:phosphotriesterase-related protein